MSKLFKRLMCLLLGIVIGISATVGSIATSVYYLYGNVTVTDILPDDKDRLKDMLGDIGNYSAEDIVALFSKAIKAPENYTIADLERDYGLNLVDLINQVAGKNVIDTDDPDNKPYIDDLKSISLFALLSGQTNFNAFLSDIPLGALLSFIPAETILDKEQREKLRKYSVGSLLATDENTNLPVALDALSDLTVGGVLTNAYEKVGNEYRAKEGQPQALNLVANVKLGGLLSPLTGKTTFGDELVGGGLSSIGALTLGDLYRKIGGENSEELATRLDGFLTDADGNPVKIRDLFAKDISDGNDHYRFVLDKLLDSIKLGTFIGFSRKDGKWVATDGEGNDTEVTGLLSFLADLNITDLYHALTDSGSTSDRIHRIILVFGDLTVGHVFETLGFKRDESGKWTKPDGTEFKSELAEKLLDFSVRDIFGDEDQELTGTQVRLNIVGAVSGLCGDMTLGEGIGELFGIESAREGDNVVYTKDGTRVNSALGRLFDIKIRDIVNAFGGEKVDLSEVKGVFETAVAGVYLGDMLGGEKVDGVWHKGGEQVSDALSLIYEISFNGIFSLLNELNSDNFSYSEIIRGFMPETALGDIFAIFSGIKKTGVGDDAYFVNADGTPLPKGINSFLTIRLWQYASAFDPNGRYDLNTDLSDIRVGDVVALVWKGLSDDCVRGQYENVWGTNKENGNLPLILSDIFNVDIASIFNLAKSGEKLKAELCKFLNVITQNDAHTLGGYLDDLLKGGKSESVIKQNVGLDGITDIKIAELVSVILKEKTGIVADKDGTLEKFGALSSLPEDFRDLIVYICNITDKVLIGDYLRKSDGSGYNYTVNADGKKIWTNAAGEACTELLNEVLSLPTTYPFLVIGGLAYVISDPNGALEMLKEYKLGALLEPAYNALLSGYDSKMTHTGDEKTGEYTVNGIFKAFVENPANRTIGEAIDKIKNNPESIVRYLLNREVGDFVYDLFTKILKIGDKIGIDGLASENKQDGKYVLSKNALGAIFNLNIYKLIKAEDKVGYLKEAFANVTLGDLTEIYDKITKEEAVYNGRKVNEYKLDGKTFGLGVSGLLSTEIVGLIDAFKGEGKLLDRIEGVVDIDFMIGDYLTVMDILGISYNGTAWEKKGKEVYAPLNNVLKVNVKEFVNTLTGDKSAEEKRDYIIKIFDKLTIGDFLSLSDKLANLDKELLQKHIYPIVVADLIIDFITEADKIGVAKKYFGDITIGSIANLAINVTETGGVWSDGKGEMKLIVTDAFNITVNDILGIVETIKNGGKTEAIVKQVAEVVFNERSLKDYLADLKNASVDKIIAKDALQKLITSKIVDVVAKVFEKIGEKDYAGIITYYFDATSVGEFAQIFMEGLKKDGDVWSNNGTAMKLIVSDVFDVTANDIADIIEEFKLAIKSGINRTANIVLKRTFQVYVKDFGYDLSKKELFAKIRDVEARTFVSEMLEDNRLDRLKYYFGEASVGNVLELFLETERDAEGWKKKNGEYFAAMIGDVFDINVNKVIEVKDKLQKGGENVIAEVFNDIFPERRVGDLVNVVIPKLSDECVRGGYTNVWGMTKEKSELPLILSDVFNLRIKTILDAVLGGKGVTDIVLSITDEIFGDPITDTQDEAWARTFNEYMLDLGITYVNEHDAFKKIREEKVGEFIYHLLKDGEGAVDYLRGLVNDIMLRNIAELALDEATIAKLPLIVRDVFDVTIGNIIDIATAGGKLKGEICKVLNVITKKDAHTLGGYLDDLLKGGKSESVIKQNVGLDGITDIKIAELVSVILKEKTGIVADKDGTLEKFGALSSLPEDFRDLIVYICNITDKVLIGDYLRKSDGSGYNYTVNADGKKIWTNAAGEACTELLNEVLSLPTTYPFLVIGGLAYVISDPNGALEMLKEYKLGALLEPAYNALLSGYDSKMTHTGDEKTGEYTVNGIFKAFVENPANRTIGEAIDKIKNNPESIVRYLLNREVGDFVYDLFTKILKIGDKIGIDGLASENKQDGKYVLSKNALGAIFNLNIYKLIKAEDKVGYLKEAFANVTLGDLTEIYDKITKEEAVYNGRKVNEYKLDGKTFGLGVSGLLSTEIVGLIDAFKGEGKLLDRIEGVVDIDFMIGDYLTVMDILGISYNGTAWEKKGKEVYAPLNNVLKVNVKEFVNTLTGDKSAEEKRDYIIKIFDKLTIGDFLSLSDKLANLDKELLQKHIYPIVVADLIIDFITEADKIGVAKKYFGDITIGSIANLAINVTETGGVWSDGKGEMKLIVTDAFNITVNDILGIVETIKNGGKTEAIVKQVAEVVFNERSLKDYLADLKNASVDKIIAKDALQKLITSKIVDVVAKVFEKIGEKDYAGIITYYFDATSVGEFAQIFMEGLKKDGDVWSNNGTAMKLIVSDVFDVTANDIADIIEEFKLAIKSGINRTANIVLKRTFQVYVKDFGYDLSKKDAFAGIRDVVVSEFVAAMLENDRLDSLKTYFKDARLGDVVNVANDKFVNDGDVWANNGKAVKLILSDVLDVNADNVVAIVKEFQRAIKPGINKTAEIILKRTFQVYVKDFGYDLSKKDAFAGIRDVVVSEFVAAMLENNRLDSLKTYFNGARLGDVVNVVNDKFVKDGDVWSNNGKAVKLILSDVLDVNADNIVEIVKAFKNVKDGINKTAETILKRTFQAYVKDFGYDLSKKDAFAGIRDVVVSEFVAAMLENDRLDSLKTYFKDARLGDVVNVANDKFVKDGDVWSNNGKAVKLILSDVLDVNADNVVEIVKSFKYIKDGINKTAGIILKRTFQAYVKDFGYDLSKKDAFAGIRDVVVSEFVAAMLENDRLDSLKTYFKYVRLGDVINVVNDKFVKDGDVWSNNGKAVKLILSDVLDVNADNIVEIVKAFKYIKDGINKTAEIILKRTFRAYVKDFGYDLSKKDVLAGIRDVVVSEFVAAMLENDRLDSLKTYFKDVRLGDVVNVVNDKFVKDGDVWANNGKAVKLILSDVLDVNADNIVEIVKSFKYIKDGINKTAGIILKRTFQAYVKDFGYDLSKKDVFAGIRNVVVSEFVAAMLENDRLDSLKTYFKDVRLGDVVNVVNDKFVKDGDVWSNNGKAVKLILSDVLDVNADNVVEIVKSFKYVKDGINKTAEIILKRTFQAYVKDFGYDLSKKDVLAGIRDVVVSEFVAAMLENDRLDSLKTYFKDVRLGDIVNVVNDKFVKDGDVWANNGKAVKLILSDVLDVNADNVVEIVKSFKYIKDGINKTAGIILKRTFRAYVKDFGYDLSKKDAFAGVRDVVVSEFVAAMLENNRLESLKKYFGETRVGDIINLFEPSIEKVEDETGITTLAHSALKDGKRWQYKGKNFKLILSDLMDIEFNNIYNWIKVAKGGKVNATVETIVGDIFDENTFEDYAKDFNLKVINEKEMFRPIRETKVIDFVTNLLEAENMNARLKYLKTFVTGMKLGAIAEAINIGVESPTADGAKWTMKGKNIPYALSDVMSLTFDDVLDLFFAEEGKTLPSWANRIVTLLNKYTLNDEHTLKLYIEDIVGKRLINKGVADLSDIRIAELVAVALKVKTGITVDEGGTLDKFNVTNQLPANFRDIIVYVCNITDKVLIGDYFTNLNNKEGGIYRNDEGVWYNKTTEVTGAAKTVYNIPTTYVLGAVVLIAQPQILLDAIKNYKIGKLIEKPYNNVMKSVDSQITSADGVYGVNGRFKEVVESFVNITVEDIYNDVKGKKFVSNLKEMFINREIGDYLYDLGAWLAGKVTKRSVGLNGYAYERVNEKGLYETGGNLQTVYGKIFNLNILTLINQKKNIGKYLKAQFETLLLGDIFYDLGRVVTKGKLCEGYAFANKAANEEKYQLVKSMGEVVSASFNISFKQIFDCIKGKQTLKNFKKLIKDTYGELTVGDFTYDLFRKYVAGKFKLTANGYASQFKADNKSLNGKGAKFFRATFVVKINDIIKFASDVKNNTGKKRNTVIIDFVSKVYGELTLGDIFAPMIQKYTAKKLKMVYAYDDDYNVTVTGDFKEIANDVYSSTFKDLLAAIKGNKVKTYFVGKNDGSEDGLVGKHAAGDFFGYIFRDFMKKFFKYTDIEKNEESGKWTAARSYSHPLNILFNDVKIADFARIKDLKAFVLDHFGKVLVGEILGKYFEKGAWRKPDGTLEEINAENGGIIMKQVYEIMLSEIMDDNFNINYVIADIYVGELIGYYHCGLKYTKEVSLTGRFNVCKDETHVDKNGYHIHEDECDVPLHDHSVGTSSYESGWYKDEGGNIVPVTPIESVMADIRLGYMLGNSEVDFGAIFGDMTVGNVLGYEYCGGSDDCTVTTVGHTHDARVGKTWYVKESTGVRRANALERTMANVKMKDIVDGTFNIDKELTSLKLGNLMNYEYCDGTNDCYVDHATHAAGWYKQEGSEWTMIGEELYYDADDFKKFASASLIDYPGLGTDGAGWYHKTGSGKWEINNLGEAEQGEHIGNNLTLCILDYSMSGIRSDSFSKGLMDKVNKNVRVGDIFDPVTTSGPVKLISANTAIGNISGAISEAMKVATAGELMNYGMFPIETSTKDKMAIVYGSTLAMSWDYEKRCWKTDNDNAADDGNDVVSATGTNAAASAAMAAYEGTAPSNLSEALANTVYIQTVGEAYWTNLTINGLVDVLLTRVQVS